MSMTLDQALALCEHASPMPHIAGQALRVMRDEIARLNELTDRFSAAINEMTGPTFMGEPVLPHSDNHHVEMFADDMKRKLAAARAKGRGGWDDDEPGMQQRLSDMLRAHVLKGDPCDVANFCMFLHQRGEAILPGEPVAQGEADGDRAAYEGAREDLLDWKGRAQRAEATLRSLGYVGVDASQAPTAEPVAQGEAVDEIARLKGVIERDRTVFCNLIAGLKRELQTREWLGDENARATGGYRYDEPGFIREFGEAWTAIMAALNRAHNTFRDFSDCPKGDAVRSAQAEAETILAAQPRAVPDGLVLVPIEPTPEMLAAVAGTEISVRVAEDDTAEYPVPEDDCAEIYRNMLAAAPSPGES